MSSSTLVTVVVPCCNEEESLPLVESALARLASQRWDFRYIFVDDGSTDATWSVLQRLFGHRSDCRLLRHPENRGVTAACMTGLRSAETEIVAVIDCDCSYDPVQLFNLLEKVGPDTSCVTASPYHPQGRVEGAVWWRIALSRLASRLYRMILGGQLWTYTSCFRVYRRSQVLDLPVANGGFLGMAEIIAYLLAHDRVVLEVPAVLRARTAGKSKLRVIKTAMGHFRLLASIARNSLGTSRT
jgi:glycosyltransferase involved in cell wall biosynthesis